MKKSFAIIIFFIATIILTGCKKDLLNKVPLDTYSNSTLWTSANDALTALNGCYSGWENGDHVIYYDCFTDNAYDQFPWEGYEPVAQGNATPTNLGAANRWSYITIQRCNWFLANVDKTPMADDLKSRMKGEARFLRAYQYFIMSQLYSDVPLIINNISIEHANLVTVTPRAEVTLFVLNELNTISGMLPVNYPAADAGRITRGAALALAARVELFNQKYTDCIATCQQLMNSPFSYSLYPDYTNLFRPGFADNQEEILDIQYLKTYNSFADLGVLVPNSKGGYSSVAVTQSLVDAYEMNTGKTIDDPSSKYNPVQPFINRDPRLDATILRPGASWEGMYFDPLGANSADYYLNNNCSPTGYISKKFISNLTTDFSNIWDCGLDFMVIRYAEVLLTYAEAKIEAGQIDQSVYDAINKVRNRVNMPPVNQALYNNQTSLRKLVRRERRVEFGMEGLRWYDIQRWRIGDQVMPGKVYGTLKGSVDEYTGNLTLDPSTRIQVGSPRAFNVNKNYLWPIPQKEIDLNKNLKQNADY
ncbi:RagB/SusD family nutrient uptake outer membrane protein [Chitinophaga niastensis]|nr:RagB/SusD family nutrient uptake outer membrane protein [Chitinophaga niastensis]